MRGAERSECGFFLSVLALALEEGWKIQLGFEGSNYPY